VSIIYSILQSLTLVDFIDAFCYVNIVLPIIRIGKTIQGNKRMSRVGRSFRFAQLFLFSQTNMTNNLYFFYRGFSYVDLIQDRHNHKYYALKRIACHSKEDERLSMTEVEIMKTFEQRNLCPCVESSLAPINDHLRSIISEVLIVMPYYRVREKFSFNQINM
jgi:hypothetical protein